MNRNILLWLLVGGVAYWLYSQRTSSTAQITSSTQTKLTNRMLDDWLTSQGNTPGFA